MTRNGELVVEVDNDEDAALLSKLHTLGGVTVAPRESKPPVIAKGMVYGVHRSLSDAVIVDSLKRVGVVEAARVKAHDPRLGALINTDRVILTFAHGAPIPEQVCIGLNLHAVVARYDPLQCYRCNKFGHGSKNCDSESNVCRRCSESGHVSKLCEKPERCANCAGPHSSKYGACPVRLRILENWRRSNLPAAAVGVDAVPLLTKAPGVNAHEEFRVGRTYAGVVQNGVRVPQRPDSAVTSVPQTSAAPVAQPRSIRPPAAVPIDIDAITAQISERVLATVIAQLTPLITKIVTDVVSEVLPKFAQKIITTLRPQVPAALASPFDIEAISRLAGVPNPSPQGDSASSTNKTHHE